MTSATRPRRLADRPRYPGNQPFCWELRIGAIFSEPPEVVLSGQRAAALRATNSHIIAVTAEWLEAKRVYLGAAQAEGRRDMQAEEFYLARCSLPPHDQPAHLQAGFRVEIACHLFRATG
jgi:hypothetical protein